MVGIPYKFKGNNEKGMGCFELVQHFFRKQHGKDISFEDFKEVSLARKNDVVLFEKGIFHCGVMLTNHLLLSTDQYIGSSYVIALRKHYNFDKVTKVFRHESFL